MGSLGDWFGSLFGSSGPSSAVTNTAYSPFDISNDIPGLWDAAPAAAGAGDFLGMPSSVWSALLPAVIGGATKTYGDISSAQYSADQAEKDRQDKLFLAQIGVMKDMAMNPGGSSSSSWQEGATGNLTDAQRLAALRGTSQDKIAQYNNIMQGYYGARR